MATVTIGCSDGSRDCQGTLESSVRFAGLNKPQLAEITAGHGTAEIELSARQVERNIELLSADEKDMRESDGSLFIEVKVHTICDGCGSDVSRDSEGNVLCA